MPWRRGSSVVALAIVAAACTAGTGTPVDAPPSTAPVDVPPTVVLESAADKPPSTTAPPPTLDGRLQTVELQFTGATLRREEGYEFPPAPEVPTGPLPEETVEVINTLFDSLATAPDLRALGGIADSGDPRLAWLMSDLLRFFQSGSVFAIAVGTYEQVTGVDVIDDPVAQRSVWQSVTDHLIAWDLPAPPDYVRWKRQLFTLVDERWDPFFADENAEIDWRFMSWGGVLLDDRPLGTVDPCPRGCIPSLDDPAVTGAEDGFWYPDDALVFGVVVGSEARAYPKNIMEVHEMVNDTLGGRRLGIPYCTLCGSAQAYFTDSVPGSVETPVLRTSGLLTRSNKVMFDLNTFSVFDTFTGEALSGPLHDAGIVLEQTSIVTSTWEDWRVEHPDTTIVAADGGIGRDYPLDPLGDRDAGGPIFPTGDVDERLPVQALVLGVKLEDGTTIAFPVDEAGSAIDSGVTVEFGGVVLVRDGSGLRAQLADGSPLVGHQAFWFAWSQFHPGTLLWAPGEG